MSERPGSSPLVTFTLSTGSDERRARRLNRGATAHPAVRFYPSVSAPAPSAAVVTLVAARASNRRWDARTDTAPCQRASTSLQLGPIRLRINAAPHQRDSASTRLRINAAPHRHAFLIDTPSASTRLPVNGRELALDAGIASGERSKPQFGARGRGAPFVSAKSSQK